MGNKERFLKELDEFVKQHDVKKFECLNEFYLDLTKNIEYLWTFGKDMNAFDATVLCLKLESKVQLFIFYLDQIKNEGLDLEESEIVRVIEKDYDAYCLEMINEEMVGNLSIFFKKKNIHKGKYGRKLSFKV